MGMKSYKSIKRKLLEDKIVQQEYERLSPQFSVVRAIMQKRMEKGISQKELAERIGTRQSAIARFESGAYNPTLSFIGRLADALDADVRITVK
jgi:predicted transcriptional regulator